MFSPVRKRAGFGTVVRMSLATPPAPGLPKHSPNVGCALGMLHVVCTPACRPLCVTGSHFGVGASFPPLINLPSVLTTPPKPQPELSLQIGRGDPGRPLLCQKCVVGLCCYSFWLHSSPFSCCDSPLSVVHSRAQPAGGHHGVYSGSPGKVPPLHT